ncbi:MAG: magnesium and cobalt transport protein CorA [Phenylobacterium sp.]|uniref:magnesium and cobalt transport protein CorA n=1 Tax=Phenylobacterium sp. TaxID=1871053 RepID=UPI00273757F4|nr:magnesium and cobalt transport protein CorA [Phenylobacterium sp.]MDP3117898.1 magnesium and cobalt transport protein CorA [Phenylobacterium sp.]MDP3385119.1 magnesium and cobalt transport protein CorA [Phenylobacterium sp.]
MSIVAAYVYKDGLRVREASLSADGLALGPGEFVWIGLLEPDEAELRTLQARFNLHPLAVEDALSAHQLPKVETYGNELFVVARTAQIDEGETVIQYGETHIFLGAGHIITVRHGSARGHVNLRAHLEASPALLNHGPDYVLHAILDFVVDGYTPIVDHAEEAVLSMEQRALDTFLSRAEIRALFQLRRELLRFERVLGPMEEAASRLERLEFPGIDPEVRPYFRDIRDHARRVNSRVGALRETLTSVFEVSNLLEQQRQGVITRRLAAWAAILAVPTAIAGIYGMNFDYLPELHWRYGYPAVLAVIAAICTSLYLGFRRSKWL